MATKPTYEELKQKIKELEKEAIKRNRVDESLFREKYFSESILDSLPGIFYFFNDTGKFLRWNKNFEKVSGCSAEEISIMNPLDFFEGEDKHNVEDKIQEVFIKGESFVEADFVSKNGKKTPYYFTGVLIQIDNKNHLGGLGINIAERKQTEEALRESEEKYKFLTEELSDVVLTVTLDGRLSYVSPAIKEFGEYDPEEEVGNNIAKYFVNKMELISALKLIKEIYIDKKASSIEFLFKPKNKEPFYVEVTGRPLIIENKVVSIQCVMRNITKRKKAEQALLESEKKYRHIFENVSDFLYYHDLEGNFIETNLALKKEYGFNENELVHLSIRDMMPEKYKLEFDDYMKGVKENGKDEGIMSVITKDGRELIVEYRSSLVFDSEGAPIGVQGSGRDITERIQAQKEKEKLEAQLQQSQKMESIGTLAGGIAHDFNNIIGIIIGNAELALGDVSEWNPAHFNLEEIRTASLRAKDVVRQLLSFARKTTLEKKPTNIIPIVKESLKFLRSSIPTSIEIRQKIMKDVDTIIADPTQINQVLINLCTNADHAMPDGGILEVSLKNVELDEDAVTQYPDLNPGRYVNLTVNDTGHGISQEEIDRIFDPYFTTKEIGKGTGMGLSVVHGIVKSHKGAISVDSKLGRETTFRIYFPVTEEEAVIETETDEELPTGNERILFVDDEESMVFVGRNRLERLGYQVETRMNPVEALKLFRANPDQFDLVITDMTMTQMTGDHLVEEILKIRPDMPTILCTGFSDSIDEEKAKEIGIRQYIEKPLRNHELAKLVRKVLDENDAIST